MTKLLLLLLCLNSAFAQQAETEEEVRLRILREYGDAGESDKIVRDYLANALAKSGKQLEALREQFYTPEMIATQSQGVLLITDEEKSYLGFEKSKVLVEARKKQRESFLSNLESKKEIQILEPKKETEQVTKPVVESDDPMALVGESDANEIAPEQAKALYDNSGELKTNLFTSFMDEKTKAELANLMKSNPMAKMSKKDVEARLDNTFKKNSVMSKALTKYPKIKEFAVEFFHDDKALSGFISILNKPEVLKKYGLCALIIFVVAFILNLLNSKASFLKRFFIKLGISLGAIGLNLAVFYFLFQKELSPAVDVFLRLF